MVGREGAIRPLSDSVSSNTFRSARFLLRLFEPWKWIRGLSLFQEQAEYTSKQRNTMRASIQVLVRYDDRAFPPFLSLSSALPSPSRTPCDSCVKEIYSSGSSSPKGLERKYDSSNCSGERRKSRGVSVRDNASVERGRNEGRGKKGKKEAHPMQTNVTILSTRRERLSRRVNGDGVQRTAAREGGEKDETRGQFEF